MLVNVASKCGNTPQYSTLEALQKKYEAKGFTVIGFPCNQFHGQEPGTAEEIATFCATNYGITFPIMEKIDVNGDTRHAIYKALTPIADAERPQRRHPVELREVRGVGRRQEGHAVLAEDQARGPDGDRRRRGRASPLNAAAAARRRRTEGATVTDTMWTAPIHTLQGARDPARRLSGQGAPARQRRLEVRPDPAVHRARGAAREARAQRASR